MIARNGEESKSEGVLWAVAQHARSQSGRPSGESQRFRSAATRSSRTSPAPPARCGGSVGVEVGVEVRGRAGLRLGSGLGTEVEIEIGVGVGGRGPSWGWGEVQGSSECAHRQGLQPRGICLREGGSGLLWWVLK